MKKNKSNEASIHSALEDAIRLWAANIQGESTETSLEVTPVELESFVSKLVDLLPKECVWILFLSNSKGDVKFICNSSIAGHFIDSGKKCQMVSIVSVGDGAGLTFDVSEERRDALVASVSAWGRLEVVLSKLHTLFSDSVLFDGGKYRS
jgi:hypothetical protein